MKMTYKISIADALTGETIEREMTADEVLVYEAEVAKRLEKYEATEQAKIDNAAAKAALLDRLGITAEEAKLLLG